VTNPAEGDAWWDSNSDNDTLTNAQEVLFGSDPYSLDSDRDGLTDSVEYIYSQDALTAGTPLPFAPWLWDSNNNGFSDFDEYYQQIQGYQPVVNYTSLPAGSTWTAGTFYTFSDADGDGVINAEDSDPLNMDRDGDGILNWLDIGYMDDANNGYVPPADNPSNDPPMDSDGDGFPDSSDPFPNGSFWYNNVEYPGTSSDRDGDNIPDAADSYPDDPTNGAGYNFNGSWYNQAWSDADGDYIPDPADAYPNDPTNGTGYNYNGTWYAGPWSDRDADGVPDGADAWPDDSFNGTGGSGSTGYTYNGTWYSGDWVDSDTDGIPDPADSYPNDYYNGAFYYNGNWYQGDSSDSDGDGIPNAADAYPSDPTNGTGYSYGGTWYYGTWADSDTDGIPDPADSYPNDPYNGSSFYYNGNWYGGTWADSDADGIPDPADSYPNDNTNGAGYYYVGIWYNGSWMDSDNDGIPDSLDSYPNDANNGGFYYGGTWYYGSSYDTDGDGIPDLADSYPNDFNNNQFLYNGTWYTGPSTDYDMDGIPDQADNWPADYQNGADNDSDGLTNYDERTQYGTNPDSVDTDGDMLKDYGEVFTWHTNPLQEKTDPNQPYTDYYMVDQTDTDSDGIPDRIEQFYCMNINDPNDALGDLDGDGYTNLEAYQHGWNFLADWEHFDADHDGILDVLEDAWNAKYPGILSKTQFNDSVQDFDGDGVMNFEEVSAGMDPGSQNSRSNAINDLQEWTWLQSLPGTETSSPWRVKGDADHDRVSDGLQAFIAAGTVPLLQRVGVNDCDGDGTTDLWEHLYQLNLRAASDVLSDPDSDSLTNLVEYRFGTNPLVSDTYHDNVNDGSRLYGTNLAARDLHGLTTRYQPLQVGDYTRPGSSGVGSFTAYADGAPEDPPPSEPPVQEIVKVRIIQTLKPSGLQYNNSTWFPGTVVSASSQSPGSIPPPLPQTWYETVVDQHWGPVWTELEPAVTDPEGNITQDAVWDYIDDWIIDGWHTVPVTGDPPPYDPASWVSGKAAVQVSLSATDRDEEHTFKFKVTTGTGVIDNVGNLGSSSAITDERIVPLTIPKNSAADFKAEHSEMASQGGWVKIELVTDPPKDGPDPQTLSFSTSDGAGSRYRKISLTGVPMPDAKPQVQDESGEREEETHIDAYNRRLQHGVTDIYASDPSTLLPLSVRRDATSESWSRSGGLRPSERADLPFGPGWTSNLCSFVRYEDATDNRVRSAEVHDEQGATQRFLSDKEQGGWHHSHEELSNARTRSNTFNGLTLTKKFGTTCMYMMCSLTQTMPKDRLQGSAESVTYTYARLMQVWDRLGNRLVYEYPNGSSLIPSRVYDPDREGRQIYVMHANGRVSSVRGPAGEEVVYDNTPFGLTTVKRGSSQVKYTYQNWIETQESIGSNPATSATDTPDAHHHTELATITDERNNTYRFGYEFDHSMASLSAGTDGSNAQLNIRLGLPMQVRLITLPDGNMVFLTGARGYRSPAAATTSFWASPQATTMVSGPAGVFSYVFSMPDIYIPELVGQVPDDAPLSLNITVTYTHLSITSAAGMESYTFNRFAMFALGAATDFSGNTHSFGYGGGFDDPVTETDALLNTKVFTYDATTRVMSSMTDQTGVVTSYEIQPGTGLKLSETVTGAGGVVERQSTYQYNHPTYRGFMTQSTVDASTDDTAPATVTNYSLGSGPLGWAEVTESTATTGGPVSSTTVHDLSGNKRSVIDGRGMVTNFDYDAHLRLTQVTHPDNSHKNLVYDEHGNLIQEINENSVSTFHEYDEFNRRIKTTLDLDGDGIAGSSYGADVPVTDDSGVTYSGDIVTTSTYNARGQVLTVTDPRGKVTTHTYDGAGRLISTDDGGFVTTMEYSTAPGANCGGSVFDSSGFKPTKITDPRGTVTTLTYDKMYRTRAQTVTYHNDAPAAHVLSSLATMAQVAYQQANALSSAAVGPVHTATDALNHLNLLCDLPAVTAIADAAAAALQAAMDAQLPKSTARTLAQQAMQTAAGAVNDAQAMADAAVAAAMAAVNDAQQAGADAIAAQATAAGVIQAATNANDTAQQNAATLSAAIEELVEQAGFRADELVPAQASVDAAQAAVSSATTNLGMAFDENEAAYLSGLLNAAYANLTLATAGLTTAQAAKTSADAAVVAGTNAANAAVIAAAAAASALATLRESTNFNNLQSAADEAQITITNAQAAYDAAVANVPNVLAGPQAALAAKTELFDAAVAAETSEQMQMDIAQTTLTNANLDLQIAQAAADDPEAMASLQSQIVDAQSVVDSATATLAALNEVTTAKQTLYNAAKQRWQAVVSGMGNTGSFTATSSTEYDAAGRPTRVTDALGRVTLTVYDVFGQIQQVTHPDNTVVSTDYTHHGKPWKVVDELGNLTQTEFDAAGRTVRSIAPAIDGVSATTTTEYDAASNVVRVTDALGHVTESQYDERNRAVAVYAPPVWNAETGQFARPMTQSSYDALGQVLTVTDPQGHVTTKIYDRAGRNWKVVAPMVGGMSPKTVTKFDPGGLALKVTNPIGQTVTNTYDLHGRMTQTTDAVGIVNTFAYDAAGNRTSVKDGKDQETTFGYDGLNRLTWQTFANGDTTAYAYNAVRKLSQTTPRGITTSYTYDARDRVLTTSAPGLNRSYSYDVAGHLLSVTEAEHEAANVSYDYDALGRVVSETSRGVQHWYGYDLAGNRISADYGTGRSVQTSYDALGRPESIVEGGRATSYGYDLGGRAVILVAGNGQTSQNSYDALGRLVDRTLFKTTGMGESEVLAQFSWVHDALGNVRQQLETWPGDFNRNAGVRSTTMTYDADNRLSTETVVEPTAVATTTAYAYDAANNRLQKTVEGGSDSGVWHYTYNAANQLTHWEQWDTENGTMLKSAALGYDQAGNRTTQNVSITGGATGNGINPPPAAGGTTSYQWDAQDRLSSVTLPDGQTHAYDYDYRTRRIGTQKFVASVRQAMTALVFAGGLSLAEFDTTTDSLPDTPTVEYMRGPDMGGGVGGMLYSMRASGTKYSLSNGRGDIVAQADSSATLTWTASYEAYGRRTTETGVNQDKQRGNSKDEDPTGLLNEGFRYRDLETGVWLSRDPAGFVDGPNVYAYVKENPWSSFDPHGLWQFEEHWKMTWDAAKEAGAVGMAYNLCHGSLSPDIPNGPISSGWKNWVTQPADSLTMRTHHGDLQPWHFMGRTGIDSPQDVKNNAVGFMMKCIQAYRGEWGEFKKTSTRQQLLGAALHTLQDSHSESHVTRDPQTGVITRIQDYNAQDPALHKVADVDLTSSAFKNAQKATRELLSYVLEVGKNGKPVHSSAEVRKYLETKAFPMSKDVVLNGSSSRYSKDVPKNPNNVPGWRTPH